jgi:hypothetical protein
VSAYDFPLAADDLRAIGDIIESLHKFFIDEKNFNYRPPFDGESNSLIGNVSIEIRRPDADDVIGYAVLEDGWIGFKPVTA